MTRSRGLWLIVALTLCQALYLHAHFPSPEQYRPGADEGIFFRGATILLDRGPAGFGVLAREFLARPDLQIMPPPTRVGHLVLAAAALGVRRSFRALSMLSLAAHVLTVLVAYVFVRRWRGEPAAICAAILVATAPLGSDLATRALSDSNYALFVVLAVFLCVDWLMDGRRSTGAWFLATLTWAALVKEVTFVLLPAFAAVIAAGSLRRRGRVDWSAVAALLVVPAVAGLVYVLVFGGVGTVLSVVRVTQHMNTFATNVYLRVYHNGPWFTFFVDGLLIAPVAMLAFLTLCGWYLARRPPAEPEWLLLVFIAASIAIFACLPYNPRYSSPVDVLMRVFTGVAIPALAAGMGSATRRAVVVAGAVAVLAVTDVVAFRQVFVEETLYDPVAASLAAARRLVPSEPARATTSAQDYVTLAMNYYRARDFAATIAMSERALAISGNSAEAYNNIGAAYCELGRWQDAIAPLETALRLNPAFALARNNLAWAQANLRSAPVR